jgi:FdhD protein
MADERVAAERAGATAVVVLAGGGSRRMGRDKASIVVDGASLLERTVAATLPLVADRSQVLVVGCDGVEAAGVRAVADDEPDAGPLAGLATGLRTVARWERAPDTVLVVGVDHPWLDTGVLVLLASRVRASEAEVLAAMLGTADGAQPLLAAYRPAALRTVEALLHADDRRLRSLRDHLPHIVVEPHEWRRLDHVGATAVDVDTPAALAGAVAWHARVEATRGTAPPAGADVPRVPVRRVQGGRVRDEHDVVIGEEPLEVRVAGPDQEPRTVVTTLRTPGHEAELAVGWLLAEGLCTPDELVDVEVGDALALARPDDQVTVRLSRRVDPDVIAHRHAVATASCGVCGRASIDELAARTPIVDGDPFLDAPLAWEVFARLPDELRLAQPRFGATGGVHATGLFDASGRLVTVREDVGRHNALDAAIGAHVLGGVWPDEGLSDLVAVLSGRIGFELVAKAAVARVPIVAAVGAASDLAVRTAERLGVTLVGFLRRGDGTIYTHAGRIT